jgi:hypothetical protein
MVGVVVVVVVVVEGAGFLLLGSCWRYKGPSQWVLGTTMHVTSADAVLCCPALVLLQEQ